MGEAVRDMAGAEREGTSDRSRGVRYESPGRYVNPTETRVMSLPPERWLDRPPGLDLPARADAFVERFAVDLAKEFTWQVAGFALDLGFGPGAGRLLDAARSGLKFIDILNGIAEGDGVRPTLLIHWLPGLDVTVSTTVGADYPGPSLDLKPQPWEIVPPDRQPAVELDIEPGKHKPATEPEPAEEPDTTYYDLQLEDRSLLVPRIRAGFTDSIGVPAFQPARRPAEFTGLAIAAPVRNVLAGSNVLSPDRVLTYAERYGAVRRDGTDWYLNIDGSKGNVAGYPRRRRINTIAYIDTDTGYIAVVELSAGQSPALTYLIVDEDIVPAGWEARSISLRPLPRRHVKVAASEVRAAGPPVGVVHAESILDFSARAMAAAKAAGLVPQSAGSPEAEAEQARLAAERAREQQQQAEERYARAALDRWLRSVGIDLAGVDPNLQIREAGRQHIVHGVSVPVPRRAIFTFTLDGHDYEVRTRLDNLEVSYGVAVKVDDVYAKSAALADIGAALYEAGRRKAGRTNQGQGHDR
jgi:hypothetical protein